MLKHWLLHFAVILSVRMTSNITGSLKSRNNNNNQGGVTCSDITYRTTESDCNISVYYRISNQLRIEKQKWVWPEVCLCKRLKSLPLEPILFFPLGLKDLIRHTKKCVLVWQRCGKICKTSLS